jgi:hypothetical protein
MCFQLCTARENSSLAAVSFSKRPRTPSPGAHIGGPSHLQQSAFSLPPCPLNHFLTSSLMTLLHLAENET